MTVLFWFLVFLMVVVALLLLLRGLLFPGSRGRGLANSPVPSLYSQRLRELEQDVEDGVISAGQMAQARLEMEHALVRDLPADNGDPGSQTAGRDWHTAAAVVLAVPVLAAVLYGHYGSPGIIRSQQLAGELSSGASREQQLATIAEMVDSLADRMHKNPDDAEGWTMLGRSYKVLHRYAEAAMAYEHVHGLEPDNVDIILQYADTLAMVNDGRMAGRPQSLVEQALLLEPDNPMALWLAGIAARETGDDTAALQYWQKLLPLVNADADAYRQVREMIAEISPDTAAGAGTGNMPAAQAGEKSLRVSVGLSESLSSSVQPGDTLYIFARAVAGPPMPVAAARLSAADLPAEVVLNDSMAMMPELKLSGFEQVQVAARISRSGNPVAVSGDLESQAVIAAPGQDDQVRLTIDTVIP